MKLIGICGLARCGKDSLFNLSKPFFDSAGKKYKRYAFADSLKQEADELLSKYVGISAFTEDTSQKQIIRPFLVTYGTHVRRKLNKNCWVDKIKDDVQYVSLQHLRNFETEDPFCGGKGELVIY